MHQCFDKKKNYADTIRLHGKMTTMGYTIPKLADEAGMAPSTLRNKMNGHGQFCVMEQTCITLVLEMTREESYEIFMLPYEQLFYDTYEK